MISGEVAVVFVEAKAETHALKAAAEVCSESAAYATAAAAANAGEAKKAAGVEDVAPPTHFLDLLICRLCPSAASSAWLLISTAALLRCFVVTVANCVENDDGAFVRLWKTCFHSQRHCGFFAVLFCL
jgi:hypothetical protein